jgi:CRP-like cAMP-binding protein
MDAIEVILQRMKRNGCTHFEQVEYYGKRGDFSASLKELNILYHWYGLTQNEDLVHFLHQAWQSYSEYRQCRTERARKWGNDHQAKVDECERGRLQVEHWRQECFRKNAHSYYQKALTLLHKAPLFKDLQDGHPLPALLAPYMQRRVFPEDRLIFKFWGDPEGIYFLESGEINIFPSRADNDPTQYKTVHDGEYFGEGPPLIGTVHRTYARAKKECVVYLIETETFRAIIEQFEEIKHRFVFEAVRELKRTQSSRRRLDVIEAKKQERKKAQGVMWSDFKANPMDDEEAFMREVDAVLLKMNRKRAIRNV